jgi:DNA polymerase III subunit delta'
MQFQDIIGQQKAKGTFHRMVEEDRLAHALILKGRSGIGKLAFATAIAQFINCEQPAQGDSCGKCAACVKIAKGIHPDVRYILPIISGKQEGKPPVSDDFFPQLREAFFVNPYYSFNEWIALMDGDNKQVGIRIHEIRELKRKITLKAFEGKYKVVIIWNAEKINTEAANAMLKLLEEPPERTVILMTVSDTSQLLTTINSRCQRIQMHRIPDQELAAYLVSRHGLSEDHATQLSQLAEGDIARALELANETNKSVSELYMAWLRLCMKGNFAELQDWGESVSKENKEYQKLFLSYALQKMRDSLLFSFQAFSIAQVTPAEREFQEKFSKFVSMGSIDQITRLMEDSLYYIGRNVNSQMVFSVLSLRMHSVFTGKSVI